MYKGVSMILVGFVGIIALFPLRVDALIVGVPIVAISLVKIVAVVLSIVAVPLTVLARVIRKDWKWAILITLLIVVGVLVSAMIVSHVTQRSTSQSTLVSMEDKVTTEAEPRTQGGAPLMREVDDAVTTPVATPSLDGEGQSVGDYLLSEFVLIGSVVIVVLSLPLLSLILLIQSIYLLEWKTLRVLTVWILSMIVASFALTCLIVVYRGVSLGTVY